MLTGSMLTGSKLAVPKLAVSKLTVSKLTLWILTGTVRYPAWLALLALLAIWLALPGGADAKSNECSARYPWLAEAVEREQQEFGKKSAYQVEGFKERCSRLDFQNDLRRMELILAMFGAGMFAISIGWLGVAYALEAVAGKQTGEARNWAGKAVVGLIMVSTVGILIRALLGLLFGVTEFSASGTLPLGG